VLRVTQAFSAKTPEIFFLSNLLQEIPGLVRLTYNRSRTPMYWEEYYFSLSTYLPNDLHKIKKKKGHILKSSLSAELILPAYIYSDRALCLDTYRVSLKIQNISESKQQCRKRKQIVNAVSAGELLWMNSLKFLTHR